MSMADWILHFPSLYTKKNVYIHCNHFKQLLLLLLYMSRIGEAKSFWPVPLKQSSTFCQNYQSVKKKKRIHI